MEIVNIIVCSLNSVDSVKSYVVTNGNRQNVELAEKEFERVAIEIGWDEDDHRAMEDLLDDGYFHNGNDKTVCISWSDSVTEEDQSRPTVEGTKGQYLKEVREYIESYKYLLPIDLTRINKDFELENGGIIQRLNESDVDYSLKADMEEFSTEYENLGTTDLEELLCIFDEIAVIEDKTQGRIKNENF